MSYIDGFVAAVPSANKDAYRKHAADAAPIFKDLGAGRMVETWGEEVPDGKVTDFRRATKATAEESIVFSWVEYPSRAARDAANEKMMTDARMKDMGATMPFDAKRMLIGGFAPVVDEGKGGKFGYADGFLIPVANGKKDDYFAMARKAAQVFQDHGATRVVEAWGDDVNAGKVTDYLAAVKAKSDESVVFSWVEWPSKEVRDTGMKKVMDDPRMKTDPAGMPFDGERMIVGTFSKLVDE